MPFGIPDITPVPPGTSKMPIVMLRKVFSVLASFYVLAFFEYHIPWDHNVNDISCYLPSGRFHESVGFCSIVNALLWERLAVLH